MSDETTTTDIVAEETASSVAPGSVESNEPEDLGERIERLEQRVEEMFHMHSPAEPPHPPMDVIGEGPVDEGTVSEEEEEHGRDHSPSGVPWTHRRFGRGE